MNMSIAMWVVAAVMMAAMLVMMAGTGWRFLRRRIDRRRSGRARAR